jgi:hypothetical protein
MNQATPSGETGVGRIFAEDSTTGKGCIRIHAPNVSPGGAKVPGLQAQGGHEHGIPAVPPPSIEQPIDFDGSADRTAAVSSLLQGVEAKRLTSWAPEYIYLHAVGSEDGSEELSCGDLVR